MRARVFWACAAAAVLGLGIVGATGATTGSLPGGTRIDVSITSPANGATLPLAPVAVSGTASVATGVPVANTLLIYVLDVSGSTQSFAGTSTCGNQNVYDTR